MKEKHQKLVRTQSDKMLLMQYLLQNGFRCFKRKQLERAVEDDHLGFNAKALSNLLYKLCQAKWISQIRRGIYIVENLPTPIYEYEIAMTLAEPAMISHRSAFRHHELTDQVLRNVTLTTTNNNFVPKEGNSAAHKTAIIIRGVEYRFVCVKKDNYFGEAKVWLGDGSCTVTDLERTLLDGLRQPHLCGGFQEVIYGFKEGFHKADLEKMISYALRLGVAVSRRLGWVLNNVMGVDRAQIISLAQVNKPGYRALDPSRKARGEYDKTWRLQLNHHAGL